MLTPGPGLYLAWPCSTTRLDPCCSPYMLSSDGCPKQNFALPGQVLANHPLTSHSPNSLPCNCPFLKPLALKVSSLKSLSRSLASESPFPLPKQLTPRSLSPRSPSPKSLSSHPPGHLLPNFPVAGHFRSNHPLFISPPGSTECQHTLPCSQTGPPTPARARGQRYPPSQP